jgi:large subunit ribosomal protein L22
MEVKAIARFVRVSPQKVRLVMAQIRGERVEDALGLLSFAPQKGAKILKKLVDSAVANVQENTDMDVDNLYVARIFADEGPTQKRWRPRALGRATKILKRTSHLTVILDEKP